MLVVNVSEVEELRRSDIKTAPFVDNQKSTQFIEGVCNRDKGLLIVIEPNNILTNDELLEIKAA